MQIILSSIIQCKIRQTSSLTTFKKKLVQNLTSNDLIIFFTIRIMKIIILAIIAFYQFSLVVNQQIKAEQSYVKIIHNFDPEAKCLDGSPSFLYIHEGKDKKNFIIFFYGGGFFGANSLAETLQTAYQRSKTQFGSSLYWPNTQTGSGYLSTNFLKSKFSQWTKIMVPYCDGAFHQGYAQKPLQYKDATLYFRGALITRAHFNYLNARYGLFNAQKLILTGGSAGAVAVLQWTNYLRSKMTNPNAVFSIPDSGIFLDEISVVTQQHKLMNYIKNTYKLSNVEQKTPINQCNLLYPGEEYKCLFFEYSYQSIQGRMLILESQYDYFSIQFILEIPCPTQGKIDYTLTACNQNQLQQIEIYRFKLIGLLSTYLSNPKNSVWTIACSSHCFAFLDKLYDSSNEKVPQSNGLTVRSAVQRFVLNNQKIASADLNAWPSNKGCAF